VTPMLSSREPATSSFKMVPECHRTVRKVIVLGLL
jgi:hypothetical protein